MNKNYAVINGKHIELTDEQVKTLGIERKNPFERVAKSEKYYYIDGLDEVHCFSDDRGQCDNESFECSNYFNDEDFAKQVALHQLLYRKLLKFAWDNRFEDTTEWNRVNPHWCVRYICDTGVLFVDVDYDYKSQSIYFSSDEAAIRAIKEVVEPFMKKHPDFVW